MLKDCEPGLCTSLPMNVTSYRAQGGNSAMGGNWSDGDGPCPLQGISPEAVCDDECTPLLQTWDHNRENLIYFWVLNISGIVIGIVFELSLLMMTAVRSAVKVSACLDLRLIPLNADRAKVAGMLVRTAFELPDPDDDSLGVESSKDAGGGERSKFWDVVAVAFIKGKVVLTGALFKQITSKLVDYDTATWLKPYSGTMLACIMWDSMMCHTIMKNSEIRAIGVT